ncbi:MAG: methylated-DNA--[protein]-cysteine S-methyltransferase [Bacteroidota bacterium]
MSNPFYDSLSGFSDSFKSIFEVSPTTESNKQILNITRIETPLAPMFACAVDDGICLLEFTDRQNLESELKSLLKLLNATIVPAENKHFDVLRKQLDEYFKGSRKKFELQLVTPGTAFQQQVWEELQTIPFGSTRSYKQQSIALKNPEAIRAVAHANGMNRIAIIIPCHRVIGSDGDLTGYAGGISKKKWLLNHEQEYKQSSLEF